MSETFQSDPETRKAVDEFKRILRQKSKQEREAMLRQARDEALADELAEAREVNEREAEALRDVLSSDDPKEASFRAREQAKSAALLLIMVLLILWLIAAATGRTDILRLPGSQQPQPTLVPRLGEGDAGANIEVSSARQTDDANMPAIGSLEQPAPQISGLFLEYYNLHGGERIFGRALSPEMEDNGRKYQWFERARLEQWPEHAGTQYAVQSGLLGYEFTKNYPFPTQDYFIGQPDAQYFRETKHGVTGRFLQFWNENGGLDTLGFPISEQIQEVLSDKKTHTVQYFERGRIEEHLENPPPYDMELGLLGRAIYLDDGRLNIVTPTTATVAPPAATSR
jgi:hypothetical protein